MTNPGRRKHFPIPQLGREQVINRMAKKTAAEIDAVEAGRLTRQDSARVALLCARSVWHGKPVAGKMSVSEFAKTGNFTKRSGTILKNIRSWDAFAKAHGLPMSKDLVPGQEVDFDADELGWSEFRPTADAGADHRVGGAEVAELYAEAAAEVGTTKGMAIRVGSNTKALQAAIMADPKVAKVAQQTLDKLQQQKYNEAFAKLAAQGKQLQDQLQAEGVDTTHKPITHDKSDLMIVGEAMVEIGKVKDEVTAIRDLVAEAKDRLDTLVSAEVGIGDSYIGKLLEQTSDLAIDIATSVQGIKLNQEV